MDFQSASKETFSAMQAGEEIGRYNLESKACTRSFGGVNPDGAIDLAGKQISTTGAGCQSGMQVEEYRKASRSAVLSIDGAPIR